MAGHPAEVALAATAMRVGAARSASMSGRYRVVGRIRRARDTSVVGAHPRVIAATSNFADVGDITTLANPEIVEQIRHHVQAAKVAHGEVPRELTEAEEVEIKAFGAE